MRRVQMSNHKKAHFEKTDTRSYAYMFAKSFHNLKRKKKQQKEKQTQPMLQTSSALLVRSGHINLHLARQTAQSVQALD